MQEKKSCRDLVFHALEWAFHSCLLKNELCFRRLTSISYGGTAGQSDSSVTGLTVDFKVIIRLFWSVCLFLKVSWWCLDYILWGLPAHLCRSCHRLMAGEFFISKQQCQQCFTEHCGGLTSVLTSLVIQMHSDLVFHKASPLHFFGFPGRYFRCAVSGRSVGLSWKQQLLFLGTAWQSNEACTILFTTANPWCSVSLKAGWLLSHVYLL